MANLPADPLAVERRRLTSTSAALTAAAAAALDAELAPLRRAALRAATRPRRAT